MYFNYSMKIRGTNCFNLVEYTTEDEYQTVVKNEKLLEFLKRSDIFHASSNEQPIPRYFISFS